MSTPGGSSCAPESSVVLSADAPVFVPEDTSDLLERSSQGSAASSTPGRSRRNSRGRGDKSYVPLYHFSLSPEDNNKYADLSSKNLFDIDINNGGDWFMGLLSSGGESRYRSGSNMSDAPNRSAEWLNMQAEWSLSKLPISSSNGSHGNFDMDISATESSMLTGQSPLGNCNSPPHDEASERKRWSEWAICAAEMERVRRIIALEEIDREEAKERLCRRQWAIDAIEEERNQRLSENFLTNLTSTNWFHEAILSQNNRDYDVVCPFYKLGCRVTCKRSDIEKHVKSCFFGFESNYNSNSEVLEEDYEVVCPNSVLGCQYIGGKRDLMEHLEVSCEYKGKTKQEEQEERHLMRQAVISYCEEERVRRLTEDKVDVHKNRSLQKSSTLPAQKSVSSTSGENAKQMNEMIEQDPVQQHSDNLNSDQQTLTLHLFMEKQMNHVVTGLHNETVQFWIHWQEQQKERRQREVRLVQDLQLCIRKLWNFATLEPFGSWAIGLPGSRSDIDLVVCFEDDIVLAKVPNSRNNLLKKLAKFLELHAKHLITINKVLLHTRVPLIKASTRLSLPLASSVGGIMEVIVELDISIDGPEHSGLATTSLCQSMLKVLPGLGPATTLIKEYLKYNGLCDSFTGGLASYGVFLLVALLFLRRYHANQLAISSILSDDIDDKDAQSLCPEKLGEGIAKQFSDEKNSLERAGDDNMQRRSRRGGLDKRFSSEFLFVDSSPSPPPRKDGDSSPISHEKSSYNCLYPPECSRSSSDHTPYSFINVKQQKEYGRRVAAKLLLNPVDYDDHEEALLEIEESLFASIPEDFSDDSFLSDDSHLLLKTPMLGVIIVEFLGVYGEELQCGRHGFSMRDGGFRFDVLAGPYTVAHPQANDPLLIEDPVNVMNNVAKNCFNAQSVQKAFLEAHDRFKNVVTRYSGKAGSALSLAQGESVIKVVFGLSHDSNLEQKNCPETNLESIDDSQADSFDGSNVDLDNILLYRKHFPNMSVHEATLPKQLLDDIVRSKKSSPGVILGIEFQKVLHEMLLNQQSVEDDESAVVVHPLPPTHSESPGSSNCGRDRTMYNQSSHVGIATSPKLIKKKTLPLENIDRKDGATATKRPPAKKRSSYSSGRPPPVDTSPSQSTKSRSGSF